MGSLDGSLYKGKLVFGRSRVSPQRGADCWSWAACENVREEESHLRDHRRVEQSRGPGLRRDQRGMGRRASRRRDAGTKQDSGRLDAATREGEARITWGTRLSRACYFVVFVAGVEQNEPCRQRLCSSTSNSVLLHPVRPFQQDLCCLFMSSAIPVSALQP